MLDIPPITTLPNFSIASEVMSAAERKTKSSVRSPEILAGDEDLLLEILVRLPAKSLMRFKRVSNQWFSLISDSNFSSRYALCRLNRQPEGLLTFYNQSKPCCNGLSLCRSTIKSGEYDSRVTHYVCNLATKQFKVIERLTNKKRRHFVVDASPAGHHYWSPTFDSIASKYDDSLVIL